MKYFFSVLSMLFAFAAGFAALPPMAQSSKELQAVLRSDFLRSEEMTAEAIVKIEKTDEGFIMETTHFIIPILIHYVPRDGAGPSLFDVEFLKERIAAKELD
jgi:hypothetical protein